MPRDLPLGNGDYLVTFDSRYQLRDIYFPNVGQENHTVGEPSRFGVWVDGVFAWTGDDGWDRRITYEHETLVGDTTLVHSKLGLSLRFRDAVDFDRNIYFKEVTVEDGSDVNGRSGSSSTSTRISMATTRATPPTTTLGARQSSTTRDAATS